MMQIFLAFAGFIILISMYFSSWSVARYSKNMVIGVTIPRDKIENVDLQETIRSYKKGLLAAFVLFILLFVPIFYVNLSSLVLTYFMLWTVTTIIVYSLLFKQGRKGVLDLKSNQNWSVIHTQPELLAQEAEDEYWGALWYNNPHDSRLFIDKRFGIGTTINFGKRAGKIFIYGIFGGTALLLVWLCIITLLMDFKPFEMQINEEKNAITMIGTMYNYSFEKSDIEDIQLVHKLPEVGGKTNGSETDQYLLGNFHGGEYGRCKLYVYRHYPPFIVIQLKDLTVIYNSKTPGQTQEQFLELQRMWGKGIIE